VRWGEVKHQTQSKNDVIRVAADPGICGFPCIIEARKMACGIVSIKFTGSECKQIRRLSELVNKTTLRDLFAPISKNPVFISAEWAGCHPSCTIPVAVLKAVEVAMDMALPRDVVIRFE